MERLLQEYSDKATEAAEAKAKLARGVGRRRGDDIGESIAQGLANKSSLLACHMFARLSFMPTSL